MTRTELLATYGADVINALESVNVEQTSRCLPDGDDRIEWVGELNVTDSRLRIYYLTPADTREIDWASCIDRYEAE